MDYPRTEFFICDIGDGVGDHVGSDDDYDEDDDSDVMMMTVMW